MPDIAEDTVAELLPEIWQAELDEAAVSVGWAASGKWMAAASASGAIYLLEAATGRCVKRWNVHRVSATAVAWHPDRELLASAGQDGKAELWLPECHTPERILNCGPSWVEHLAWSPSGEYLATACGRNLCLWSSKGELIQTFEEQPNTIAGIDWRADSEQLVSACYGRVAFWKPSKRSPDRVFEWKGSMLCVAWSPDARYLCHGNQDATVHLWIVATGKELQMSGYPLKVAQVSWERYSKYLATAGSPQITVWDCSGKGPAGRRPRTLAYHQLPIRALRYQQDGPLLASGCAEGRVAVWRPNKRNEPEKVAELASPITDLAWSPGMARLAAATEEGKVIAFEVRLKS